MKSIFSFAAIVLVIFLDIAQTFSYTDFPFVVLILTFVIGRKITLGLATGLLIWMYLSFVPTGPSVTTERMGVWVFLVFVSGLIQTAYGMYRLRK